MQNGWSVPRLWPDEICFIVAGGPSVAEQDVETLRGRKVIVINSSCYLLPWAAYLFFTDERWWRENRQAADTFADRAVTCTTVPSVANVLRLKKRRTQPTQILVLSDHPAEVSVRRTSLTGAINLALHLGVNRIVLLGVDGKPAPDGRTHHHPPHKWPQKPGCWDEQKKDLCAIAPPLRRRGIEILNASPGSAWADLWPVLTLQEALARVDAVIPGMNER